MTHAATPPYEPLTLACLAPLLRDADESLRWRLIAEFLEEYRWEPEHWDVFLAALAEHLAARDGRGAPAWSEDRALYQFWFPFNTRAARVDAILEDVFGDG